jgi:hypothetical protein
MSQRIIPFVGLLAASGLVACVSRDNNEGSAEALTAAPPSDASRIVRCKLGSLPASARKANFRGKDIEYFPSDEIPYESADWWKSSSPWMSDDILDSTILGYPGFKGSGRDFSVTQPVNARVVAVDVRNIGGKLHYHYFSNETASSPMENWSSTKSLSMLMAAHSLRKNTNYGLLSTVYTSQSGGKPTGWVGTFVNEVALTSNNSYAVWFRSLTGANGAQNFVRNWLTPNAEFGGGHGSGPAALGNWFSEGDTKPRKQLARAGTWNSVSTNTLMPVAMVEFWKRLAVNSDDPITWLKDADYTSSVKDAAGKKSTYFQNARNFALTDDDLKVLLYGFVNSQANGGLALGANNNDSFVDAFGGKSKLDNATGGQWRFFGKTGSGGGAVRSGRTRNEAIFGGFFCLPEGSKLEPKGRLVAFFVNVQTAGSASGPRQAVLANLASALLPNVTGGTNHWGAGATFADGDGDVAGEAKAEENTVIKADPVSAGSLTNSTGKQDKKCSVPSGQVFGYSDREAAAGDHMRLKLKFADASCPDMPLDVFVYAPHWQFKDED